MLSGYGYKHEERYDTDYGDTTKLKKHRTRDTMCIYMLSLKL